MPVRSLIVAFDEVCTHEQHYIDPSLGDTRIVDKHISHIKEKWTAVYIVKQQKSVLTTEPVQRGSTVIHSNTLLRSQNTTVLLYSITAARVS